MILSRFIFLYSILVNFIISPLFLPDRFPLKIILIKNEGKKKEILCLLFLFLLCCVFFPPASKIIEKKEWKSCLSAVSAPSLPSCSCLFSFSFFSSVLYRYPLLMLLSLWHPLLLCKLLLRRAKQRYIGFGCNSCQVAALHKCLHFYRVISLSYLENLNGNPSGI